MKVVSLLIACLSIFSAPAARADLIHCKGQKDGDHYVRIDRLFNSRLVFKRCHLGYWNACTDLGSSKGYRKDDFVRLAALEKKKTWLGLFMPVDDYTPTRIVDSEGGLTGSGRYQVCHAQSADPEEMVDLTKRTLARLDDLLQPSLPDKAISAAVDKAVEAGLRVAASPRTPGTQAPVTDKAD